MPHRADARKVSVATLVACLVVGALACPAAAAPETDLSRPGEGAGPTTVRVGLYLNDLFEVSGGDQSFFADVVMRAEWTDPRLANRWSGLHGVALDDVWHPRLQLVNQRGVGALLPTRVEVDPTGKVSYRQRWTGRFVSRMDLTDFPLDRQRFHIQLVSLGYSPEEVTLAGWPGGPTRARELSISDWEVGAATMRPLAYETGPGVPALASAQLEWEGRRFVGFYAVEVILPLIFIVAMGWTALWVDPSSVPARMSVAMTAMLTIIAYRFTLSRYTPDLSYLTRFDYFMLAATVLTFLSLVLVTIGCALHRRQQAARADRIDRWGRAALPLAFVLSFVVAFFM